MMPICSARACGRDAHWQVVWRNPRIHVPTRRKIWLACDEHREYLTEYLTRRSFWLETIPYDA